MGAAPATPIRRAARASLWIAAALTAWTAYLVMSDPGAKFAVLALLLVPPMFAAYYLAALAPSWLGFWLLARSWRPLPSGAALAVIAAAGLVAPFFVFSLFVPHYLRPPYRGENIELAPAADFVAPWGGRMVALQIPAHELLKRPASVLWVAETELTRGEYARLVGRPVDGDPRLPMTSLSREQVEAVLRASNTAAKDGRYRLPTYLETRLYSGDWWINRYPKHFFRCQSKLEPVGAQAANGLGLRGTVDNAAELVFWQLAGRGLYCVTEGGVDPHCGYEYREGSFHRSVGLSACEDRKGDKVWKHPGVGIRVVFERG
jgi:hypothetical protein